MWNKVYKVIRRDKFIDVDNNPINVGLYEVSESEYENDNDFSAIFDNFKYFKLKDDSSLITLNEHEAYYHCMEKNMIICKEIKTAVGNKILYEKYANHVE